MKSSRAVVKQIKTIEEVVERLIRVEEKLDMVLGEIKGDGKPSPKTKPEPMEKTVEAKPEPVEDAAEEKKPARTIKK